MVLTKRDREIVKAVYTHRFLTTFQIENLIFLKGQPPKRTQCRRRLQLLYHHGFLDRVFPLVTRDEGAKPIIHCLAEGGAELIAAELQIGRDEVDWRPKDNKVKPLFLDHGLSINEVRIATTLAAERQGFELEKWIDEKTLKNPKMRDYVTISTPRGRSRRVPVIPDGYFVLNLGGKRAHFFLEVDQATLSNTRWRERAHAYLSYTSQGLYQKRYQTRSLRILTITTGEKRLENLKATTEAAGGERMFWFTTFDQATPDVLTAPVWHVASKQGLHTLIELPMI